MERDSSLNTQTKGGEFAMELPLVSDFLTTVRLATGGVCAVSGLDVDYTEDIKVCITEGLLILKRNGYARARVSFFFAENGKIKCALSGLEQGGNAKEAGSADDEISFALLSALVAENNVTRNGETVTAITFYA